MTYDGNPVRKMVGVYPSLNLIPQSAFIIVDAFGLATRVFKAVLGIAMRTFNRLQKAPGVSRQVPDAGFLGDEAARGFGSDHGKSIAPSKTEKTRAATAPNVLLRSAATFFTGACVELRPKSAQSKHATLCNNSAAAPVQSVPVQSVRDVPGPYTQSVPPSPSCTYPPPPAPAPPSWSDHQGTPPLPPRY